MKILVTGGTSTIGKHLKNILPQATYINSVDCDLTHYDKVLSTFENEKPDIVVHLAALVGGIRDNVSRPVDYLEQNVLINTNTIKASYAVGVKKLIAISSTCIYPDQLDRYPMLEEDIFAGPPTPTNFSYAYSKRCMIAQIESYNKQYNTSYCYITPSNLYSELDTHKRDRAHYVTALVDKIIEQESQSGKEIELFGTGRPLRQFTHAGDVANVIKLMIERGIFESFNVSDTDVHSVDELARITLKELGKQDWNIVYRHPEMDGQLKRAVSNKKMMKLLPDFQFTKFANGVKKVYISKKQEYGK